MTGTARSRRGGQAFRAGQSAEFVAALYLRLKGYRILESRLRTPVGEIDLVARKGRTLIFAEVKWRPTRADGAMAIAPRQRERIRRAASWYLVRQGCLDMQCRFDVVLVVPWRLPGHIRNAW